MAIHMVSALAALAVMGWLWVRRASYARRAASLIAATLLISPYFYAYDALILTGAAAFLLAGETTNPETLLVILACVIPGLAFIIYDASVPIAAWLMLYVAARHAEPQASRPERAAG
jgi:hypothetical protein